MIQYPFNNTNDVPVEWRLRLFLYNSVLQWASLTKKLIFNVCFFFFNAKPAN